MPSTHREKRQAARHARKQRRSSLARGIAVGLVAVIAFVGTAFGYGYAKLQGNINSVNISDILGSSPAPHHGQATATGPSLPTDAQAGMPVNLLLMGSDDRTNTDDTDSGIEGMRNDTTILMHISADRTRIEMISIPRDSYVTIPPCPLPDGSETREQTSKFNAAFALGGQTGDVAYAAACTIKTVMSLTNVPIDGFMVVDFNGFAAMVDALGGVDVEIPEDISDDEAGLYISAGLQHLDGQTALAYARVRKSVGDGSDIGRIARQQQLIGAIIDTALSKNLLKDWPALYGFLDAATQSLTASDNYASIGSLGGLAWSIRSIDPANIQFVTVPWDYYGTADVVWTDQAEELWASVIADQPLPADIEYTAPLAPAAPFPSTESPSPTP